MYNHEDLMKDRREAAFQRDLEANERLLRQLAVSKTNEICLYNGGDRGRMIELLRSRGFQAETYFAGIRVVL